LEKIRYGRKITQEDFVEGIVSLRQYQRYRSGECEITYEKIDQFARKLGIPTKKLMNEFERENNEQYRMIDQFYGAVVNKDATLVTELKEKLGKGILFNEDRRVYYQHALILNDYYNDKITKEEACLHSANQVNYPGILKQKFFTDIEILILSFMLNIIEKEGQGPILKKLTSIFDSDENIMSGESDIVYALILMRLSQTHGSNKNYPKVIHLCDLGIQHGIAFRQFYLMEYFFYYKALAHFSLQEYDKYEESLFRCYACLHMEGNKKKIEKFTKLIEADFQIVYDTFILKYLKRNIV
jgi:transcriptional regulator with XRE-family HTH domain